MEPLKRFLVLLKDTFFQWSSDKAPRMGAALAYYAVFSLAPLLLIAITIAGLVFGEEASRGEIFHQIEATVGPSAAKGIEDLVKNAGASDGNVFVMVIGGVLLLLGASGVFVELQDSLNTIWRASPSQGSGLWHMIRRRFLTFSIVLGIGFLLLVSLIVSAVLAALGKFLTPSDMPGGLVFWQCLNALVSFGFITLLFAALYRFLPDVKICWKDVWLGAALTAGLFTLGKFLLGLYLGQAAIGSSFGAAGSLVVILVWIYYSSQIFLFGAEFTRLYSVHYGCASTEAPTTTPAAAGARKRRAAAAPQP